MADVVDLTGVISTLGIFVDQSATSTPDMQYFCGINQRGFNQTVADKTTEIVMVCGPGAPIEILRAAGALDWSLSGNAGVELEAFTFAQQNWYGKVRTIGIVLYTGNKTSLTPHSYFQGPGLLNGLNLTQADADSIVTADISVIKGSGALVYTVGSPTWLA